MHIVHFSAGRINPAAAKIGLVNVIYWLVREQVKAGHHVSVIVLPKKRDYESMTKAGFDIIEYSSAPLGGFAVDKRLLRDIDTGDLKIDIAHLHSIWSPTMAAVGAALHRRRIPYVISSHGSFSPMLRQKQKLLKWGFKMLYALPLVNNSLFIHLHSKGESKDARDFGARVPIVVAEQGFSTESIPSNLKSDWISCKYPEHDRAFKIVFLGRLDPWHKGIDLLLEGLSLIGPQIENITLFLIGPEKKRYKSQIPALVAKLGLTDRVVFVGPVYDSTEKFSALASADLFVLTSRFEGFPLTVLEAMASGTPVLVTAGTNAADIILPNDVGIVCDSDVKAIAAAIAKAISDPAELAAMGVRARHLVRGLTWQRTASILESAYATGLEGKLA